MAKPRYPYTFALDPEEAEALERIAHEFHTTPTAAAKKAFMDRLELERAGWKVGEQRIGDAVRAIAGLDGKKLDMALEFIERL